MFSRRLLHILFAVIAMVMLLIAPTFSIGRSIIEQYSETGIAGRP